MVGLDGVVPSWMVSVSASVNLPLHRKVLKFSSGTGSPEWSRKKGRKMVVWWWNWAIMFTHAWKSWCLASTARAFKHVQSGGVGWRACRRMNFGVAPTGQRVWSNARYMSDISKHLQTSL